MKKVGITTRLLLWISVAGIIPLVVIGFYLYSAVYRAIEDSEKDYLTSSLHARAVHLRDWIESVERELLFISKSNCVQGLCDKEHVDREGGGCPFLSAVRQSHHTYRYLVAYDEAGAVVSRAGERPGCWADGAEQLFGAFARDAGGFAIHPEPCRDGENTTIAAARPVFSKRQMTDAFVLAALDFSAAAHATGGVVVEPRAGERFFIVDDRGRYVLPPEGYGDLWGERDVSLGAPDSLAEGGAVREYRDFRGVEVLGAGEPVPGPKWLLAAEIDKEVAFRWFRLLTLKASTGTAVTLALVMAVAFLMSRHLSLPMRRLAGAARSIAEGREWQPLPDFKSREASQVSVAFNGMVTSIRQKQEQLVRTSSLAALGEFSSSTVHEMRGPLSSMKLNLQGLAGRCAAGSEGGVMAGLALEQVERLERLLSDVLRLGKPLALNRESCSFASLMDEVKKTASGELEELGVGVTIHEDISGRKLYVDRELMIQALTNLVQNGAEWSGRNGRIAVSAAAHPRRKGWVRISVADSGPGIMAGEEEKVFQPFYSTRSGGTGLGLAHAKKIVEYHGGKIGAAPGGEGGAVFTIDLPEAG